MINSLLLVLALFGGEDLQPRLAEETVDRVLYCQIDNNVRMYFYRGGKPVDIRFKNLIDKMSWGVNEVGQYVYWYEEYGQVWVKTKERQSGGVFGKFVITGLYRRIYFKEMNIQIEKTELTKHEKLMGVSSVYYEYPKVPFGQAFRNVEITEEELYGPN